jgi:hypothetical protein
MQASLLPHKFTRRNVDITDCGKLDYKCEVAPSGMMVGRNSVKIRQSVQKLLGTNRHTEMVP